MKQEKDYNFWPAFSDLMLVLVLILVVVLFSAITRIGNESQLEQDNLRRFNTSLMANLRCNGMKDLNKDLWIDLLKTGQPIGISSRMVSGTQVYRFGSDLLFETGSSALLPQGKAALTAFASCMKSNQRFIERVQIQGHTDTEEGGTAGTEQVDGLSLSARRSIEVYGYLSQVEGIDPHAFLLSADAYGSCVPVRRTEQSQWNRELTFVHNRTEFMRDQNRRIEIQVKFKNFYQSSFTN